VAAAEPAAGVAAFPHDTHVSAAMKRIGVTDRERRFGINDPIVAT